MPFKILTPIPIALMRSQNPELEAMIAEGKLSLTEWEGLTFEAMGEDESDIASGIKDRKIEQVMLEHPLVAWYYTEWLQNRGLMEQAREIPHFCTYQSVASVLEPFGIAPIYLKDGQRPIDLVELMLRLRRTGMLLIPKEKGAPSLLSEYFRELKFDFQNLDCCKRTLSDNEISVEWDYVIVDHLLLIEVLKRTKDDHGFIPGLIASHEAVSDALLMSGFPVEGVLQERLLHSILPI